MTETQKAELAARIEARAAEYHADPQKGAGAGYRPVRAPRVPGQAEVGQPRQMMSAYSDYAGWLRGIAERDVPAGVRWRVDFWMGEGPSSASLTIL